MQVPTQDERRVLPATSSTRRDYGTIARSDMAPIPMTPRLPTSIHNKVPKPSCHRCKAPNPDPHCSASKLVRNPALRSTVRCDPNRSRRCMSGLRDSTSANSESCCHDLRSSCPTHPPQAHPRFDIARHQFHHES
jgi:hypothetical protein